MQAALSRRHRERHSGLEADARGHGDREAALLVLRAPPRQVRRSGRTLFQQQCYKVPRAGQVPAEEEVPPGQTIYQLNRVLLFQFSMFRTAALTSSTWFELDFDRILVFFHNKQSVIA